MLIDRFADDNDATTEVYLWLEDIQALEQACTLARKMGGGPRYRSLAAAFRLAGKHAAPCGIGTLAEGEEERPVDLGTRAERQAFRPVSS